MCEVSTKSQNLHMRNMHVKKSACAGYSSRRRPRRRSSRSMPSLHSIFGHSMPSVEDGKVGGGYLSSLPTGGGVALIFPLRTVLGRTQERIKRERNPSFPKELRPICCSSLSRLVSSRMEAFSPSIRFRDDSNSRILSDGRSLVVSESTALPNVGGEAFDAVPQGRFACSPPGLRRRPFRPGPHSRRPPLGPDRPSVAGELRFVFRCFGALLPPPADNHRCRTEAAPPPGLPPPRPL